METLARTALLALARGLSPLPCPSTKRPGPRERPKSRHRSRLNTKANHKRPPSIWPPRLFWTRGVRRSRDCLESVLGRRLQMQSRHRRSITPSPLESIRFPRLLHRVHLNSAAQHLVHNMQARGVLKIGNTVGRTRFAKLSSSPSRSELGLIVTAAHNNKQAPPQDVPSRLHRDPNSSRPPLTLRFSAHSISDFQNASISETPVDHYSVYIGTCHIILHRCARSGSLFHACLLKSTSLAL